MSEKSKQCIEALEQQLTEVEVLTSMYPNPGELVLDDPVSVEQMKAVVEGEADYNNLETRLGFTVHVSCSEKNKTVKVELVCQLPHEYPFVKPQIFIRAPELSKERLKVLRTDLNSELEQQMEGELVVGVLAEWLRERLYSELEALETNSLAVEKKTDGNRKNASTSLTRMWIYSHHIYSKIKRKDIQDWGSELGLHGFVMPGKPGIICAEGDSSDVDEFWYRVRRCNWKRICIKEQEIVPLAGVSDRASVFKFDPFLELVLDARGGKGREYHMDLGQFHSYLHEHQSGHIFSLFFGVDGKQSTEAD